MGARGIGHIRALCEVARPHMGIVTNVGPAHLELFGTLENIVVAKGELVEALPETGTAILNGDDPLVRDFDRRTKAAVLHFGRTPAADVSAEDVVVDAGSGRASFRMRTPWGSADVHLSVPGEQMVPERAGRGRGRGRARRRAGRGGRGSGRRDRVRRADAGGSHGRRRDDRERRLQRQPDVDGGRAPGGAAMAGTGRWVAVLGEMAELGPFATAEHDLIGELLARLDVGELVAVGPWGEAMASAAVEAGLPPQRVHAAAGAAEAERVVRSLLRPGDVVLVKASRVVGLRRLADALGAARRRDGGERSVTAILLAAAIGFFVSLLGSPLAIRAFRFWGWGQRIREDGPRGHLEKMGTPTMGGIVILIGTVGGYLVALIVTKHATAAGLLVLGVGLALGALGRGRRPDEDRAPPVARAEHRRQARGPGGHRRAVRVPGAARRAREPPTCRSCATPACGWASSSMSGCSS